MNAVREIFIDASSRLRSNASVIMLWSPLFLIERALNFAAGEMIGQGRSGILILAASVIGLFLSVLLWQIYDSASVKADEAVLRVAKRLFSLILLELFFLVPLLLGTAALVLPFFWVMGAMTLAGGWVLIDDRALLESMKLSFRAAWANAGLFFLIGLIEILVFASEAFGVAWANRFGLGFAFLALVLSSFATIYFGLVGWSFFARMRHFSPEQS